MEDVHGDLLDSMKEAVDYSVPSFKVFMVYDFGVKDGVFYEVLAKSLDAPLYIVHLADAAGVNYVIQAKAEGYQIYAETGPQYLGFTCDVYKREDGRNFVCSPPMKGKESQDALWAAIKRGDIDTIAADHCPFQQSEKDWGKDDFRKIPNGWNWNAIIAWVASFIIPLLGNTVFAYNAASGTTPNFLQYLAANGYIVFFVIGMIVYVALMKRTVGKPGFGYVSREEHEALTLNHKA